MQDARAFTKSVRVSPRKARLVADLVRGLSVQAALFQLRNSQLKAGRLLLKTLLSAVANAEFHHEDFSANEWLLTKVSIDAGPTMKRSKPKCRGGRSPILKRTSHFTIVVGTE